MSIIYYRDAFFWNNIVFTLNMGISYHLCPKIWKTLYDLLMVVCTALVYGAQCSTPVRLGHWQNQTSNVCSGMTMSCSLTLQIMLCCDLSLWLDEMQCCCDLSLRWDHMLSCRKCCVVICLWWDHMQSFMKCYAVIWVFGGITCNLEGNAVLWSVFTAST